MSENKPSGFNQFVTLLYLLALFIALSVLGSGMYEIYFGSPNSIDDAIGQIFLLFFQIIFWIILQGIALLLLPMTKLWRQTKGFLILSTLAVIGNLVVLLFPLISSGFENTDQESLQNFALLFVPFLLHILAIVKGFGNLKNN